MRNKYIFVQTLSMTMFLEPYIETKRTRIEIKYRTFLGYNTEDRGGVDILLVILFKCFTGFDMARV